jgi:hypothetical protein
MGGAFQLNAANAAGPEAAREAVKSVRLVFHLPYARVLVVQFPALSAFARSLQAWQIRHQSMETLA